MPKQEWQKTGGTIFLMQSRKEKKEWSYSILYISFPRKVGEEKKKKIQIFRKHPYPQKRVPKQTGTRPSQWGSCEE